MAFTVVERLHGTAWLTKQLGNPMAWGEGDGALLTRCSPLEHCTVEQVDYSQFLGSVAQVLVIQVHLNENDPQNVTPLPIRNLVPSTIPAQLLEEDVFGSVEIQVAIGVGCDLYSLPTVHLLLIEDRTTYDEQVDFHRCPVMDDIRVRSVSDRTPEGVRLSVKPIAEFVHERLDVVLRD